MSSGMAEEMTLDWAYANLSTATLVALRDRYERTSSDTYRFVAPIYACAYGLIVVASVAGNAITCHVCVRTMTRTNALIMSLAASDLLVTLCNIPFNYFRFLRASWPFGGAICFGVNFVQHMAVYNSSYTMAIIAIQRYYSVCCCLPSSTYPSATPTEAGKNSRSRSSTTSSSKICAQLSSMRAIFVIIGVTWMASAIISTFFTISATVVTRDDPFRLILSLILQKQQPQQQQIEQTSLPATMESIKNQYQNQFRHQQQQQPQTHEQVIKNNETTFLFENRNHQKRETTTTTTTTKLEIAPNLRCTNPVPAVVEQFFENRWAIKADLAKTIIVFITQYLLPLSIAGFLYLRIGQTITRQSRKFIGNSKQFQRQQTKRRRILMLFLVVAVFAVCWLPLHVHHILIDTGLCNFNFQIFMIVHWLAMSSVCYNPMLYCWLNVSFRQAAMKLLRCLPIFRRRRETTATTTTTTTRCSISSGKNSFSNEPITTAVKQNKQREQAPPGRPGKSKQNKIFGKTFAQITSGIFTKDVPIANQSAAHKSDSQSNGTNSMESLEYSNADEDEHQEKNDTNDENNKSNISLAFKQKTENCKSNKFNHLPIIETHL